MEPEHDDRIAPERKNGDLYRDLIEDSDDVFFAIDHHGRFVYLSSSVAVVTGYDKHRLLGARRKSCESCPTASAYSRQQDVPSGPMPDSVHSWEEIIHAEDRQAVVDALSRAITQRTKYEIEYRIIQCSGSPRWVLEKGRVLDATGAHRLEGVILDIHQRKHAQQINQVLFDISDAVNTTRNLDELYASIHRSLGKIIDVSNFHISLYDKENDSLQFVYWQEYRGHSAQKPPDRKYQRSKNSLPHGGSDRQRKTGPAHPVNSSLQFSKNGAAHPSIPYRISGWGFR